MRKRNHFKTNLKRFKIVRISKPDLKFFVGESITGNDAIDQASARPDFMILIYPVISISESFTHGGSAEALLGKNAPAEMLQKLSNDKQVTADTPPTFLVHTNEDTDVPAENSIYFYLALRKAKVPAEMHIYQKGAHGLGLGKKGTPFSTWPDRCADWLAQMGFCNRQGIGK